MQNVSIIPNKSVADSPESLNDNSKKLKEEYILHLADTALILAQRNAEWCGHGPILEQDIALTNISLDLLGQARNFYQYAAVLKGDNATEDTLAYLRTEREFKNLLLVEQPNGDWGQTILRQFFLSVYQNLVYTQLQQSADGQLSAIAEKSIKEVTYHLKWSSEWVIRLGNGTEESNKRMKQAVENLWMYTGELFMPAGYETIEITGFEIALLKDRWLAKVNDIFEEATLMLPKDGYMQTGGKTGIHTEYLGYVLAELQYLQRTYPGADW